MIAALQLVWNEEDDSREKNAEQEQDLETEYNLRVRLGEEEDRRIQALDEWDCAGEETEDTAIEQGKDNNIHQWALLDGESRRISSSYYYVDIAY